MKPVNQQEVFAAVVSVGSFAHAAQRLGMAEESVREYVRHLERRLGVRLLYEGSEGMYLSAWGTVVYWEPERRRAQAPAARRQVA
ncbi:helix-turn-helix domain-containing protein [Alkalilimnicola sp. S0819]|uniref:helix-turn-helix domain-containing protein n=1 Tax=Alkalilimnicola sp. S0819 TaxID=2613922 RepID=UPI0012618A61|nr:LysR family transcriptional regulator [Alkalilimnicola sp. S0819]KAB7627839.1 LysR family transcriptional regulator [Alkalilimnicola sp. S0819]MPQ15471.1 LysR family transcriptional regulator [Alkalilimnicola sp. S0819]